MRNFQGLSQRPDGGGMTGISIVVPTYNEAQNICLLYAELDDHLRGRSWELVVVDDNSADQTADTARALARRVSNVRCIQCIGDRGLCSAVHWGVQAAHGDIVVIMDGDLQHDPRLIPIMVDELSGDCKIVAGSRFLSGAKVAGLSVRRHRLSFYGNKLTNLCLGMRLTDPLTGFFATSRILFLRSIPRMQADGFKVYFDLVYHNRDVEVKELPFEFRGRNHGESKLHLNVLWLLVCDMVSKLSGGLIPPRLISFVSVGLVGAIVHFSFLYGILAAGAVFWLAQTVATVAAMVFNFTLNNALTYSADRLRGGSFYNGLLLYSIIAAFGIVANVSAA